MIIHFVCLGNIYRSRLAEAYLNSKQLPNVEVISSGIKATENEKAPISWLTQRLFKMFHLEPYQSSFWTQTSKELLSLGDLTIFFDQDYYRDSVEKYGFNSVNYEIWEIADLDKSIPEHLEKMRATEETFEVIKAKVDELIENDRF